MGNPGYKYLIPSSLSFESLKKLNQYGIEYWSARDLQSCLGYSKWHGFEPAIKKARNHAGSLAMILKTILQAPVEWSRLGAILREK